MPKLHLLSYDSTGHYVASKPRIPSIRRLLIGITAGCLCFLALASYADSWTTISGWMRSLRNDGQSEVSLHEFSWDDITPSKSLEYSPCFGPFQCARLSVPLNWNTTIEEQETGPRAAIAVIKLPAQVPVTDPRYGGPVVMNPGGPGESGIYQVITDGQNLQTIVDSPVSPHDASTDLNKSHAKYFDIVSFDPRGVNNTTPGLRCFPDAFNRQTWLLRFPDYGVLWEGDSIIGFEWARAGALGASCSASTRAGNEDDILPHVNTAQVVEDMVEIIEREGEWRALEAEKIMSLVKTSAKIHDGESAKQHVLARTAYHKGQEKLQYWGMSYGTLVGSTFAALHPDRVSRIVIDGVVDPADHYANGWLTQLQDGDMIVTKFSEYCFEAGLDKCPLYTGSSPADIEARFTSIMTSLKKSPLAVSLPATANSNGLSHYPGPEMVTYGDMHMSLLTSMFFSFAFAERFFKLLIAIETRNVSTSEIVSMAANKQAGLKPATDLAYASWAGPNQAISCMDAGGVLSNLTRDEFDDYLATLTSQSRWISPSWARNKLGCQGFTAKPAWRPDLDFVKQEWDNTSHPLLIIGNSHDTVTPLGNAQRVSKDLFPGSVVLRQNSEGHCSHSNPSLCTGRVVREYFQTGKLPRPGTVCEPEIKPFVGCLKGKDACRFEGEEARLWEAMSGLADPFGLREKEESSSYVNEWKVDRRLRI